MWMLLTLPLYICTVYIHVQMSKKNKVVAQAGGKDTAQVFHNLKSSVFLLPSILFGCKKQFWLAKTPCTIGFVTHVFH